MIGNAFVALTSPLILVALGLEGDGTFLIVLVGGLVLTVASTLWSSEALE